MQFPSSACEVDRKPPLGKDIAPDQNAILTYVRDAGVYEVNNAKIIEAQSAWRNGEVNVTAVDYVMFLRGLA